VSSGATARVLQARQFCPSARRNVTGWAMQNGGSILKVEPGLSQGYVIAITKHRRNT
jgi:hypothetical protein